MSVALKFGAIEFGAICALKLLKRHKKAKKVSSFFMLKIK
jgi:hypothetical protein